MTTGGDSHAANDAGFDGTYDETNSIGKSKGGDDAKTTKGTTLTTKAMPATTDAISTKSTTKRRKVTHACLYCRRSHMTCDLERPCTRCIKRNIGHLCHDEPRNADSRKAKVAHPASPGNEEPQFRTALGQRLMGQTQTAVTTASAIGPPAFDDSVLPHSSKPNFDIHAMNGQANPGPLQLASPSLIGGTRANTSNGNMNQFAGISDNWLSTQGQFHDMHSYTPQYGLAPEVTNEFNLLNDFLHTSLMDDSGGFDGQGQSEVLKPEDMAPGLLPRDIASIANTNINNGLLPPTASSGGPILPPNSEQAKSIIRPSSANPTDKTREFYLQAADPSGNDTPEARMQRVLKAKFDAGLLKPFNYLNGYARLGTYMDSHIAATSKQKILRQLDQFRPKFREKIQGLDDMQLIYVEMWFERTLLEYDRVFAAMAVPACCWRRTGEIFRGNKEMAELIHVPVERLRDGKISLHEILTEESLVRYWEEFGTIAFDPAHDTLLTACALKSPEDGSRDPIVNCCFSFKIRRDEHKIPSLIVGNFLLHDP